METFSPSPVSVALKSTKLSPHSATVTSLIPGGEAISDEPLSPSARKFA